LIGSCAGAFIERMPEPDPPTTFSPLRDWSRRTLDRVPAIDLYGAWMFAQAECTLALAAWRLATSGDKGDAHTAYVAALDREAQAAHVLARRLACPGSSASAA
jgi:hypothetical protein